MATLPELTALMALSEGRYVTKTTRQRALNFGRAKNALRETTSGLTTLQANAGFITFRDAANQRWMYDQNPLSGAIANVSTIAAFKAALLDNSVGTVILANGTYSVANATSQAATSLYFGTAFAARTRPVVAQAATPGGVTFDGAGATCGTYIGEGAHHLTWDGFKYANWAPVSSGVIVVSEHGTVEAAAHHLTFKNITLMGTCLGANSPGSFNDHGFYLSSAANPGPHDIILQDITVIPPADTTRLLHAALHVFGTENGSETTPWNVTVTRLTATAKDGALIWGTNIHHVLLDSCTFTNCPVFGVRQQFTDAAMEYRATHSTGTGSQGFYSPVGVPNDASPPPGTTFTSGTSFS